MSILVETAAVLAGSAAPLWVWLRHRFRMAELVELRDDGDYRRGVRDGTMRAVRAMVNSDSEYVRNYGRVISAMVDDVGP